MVKLIPDDLRKTEKNNIYKQQERRMGHYHRLISGACKNGTAISLEAAITTTPIEKRLFHIILCHKAPNTISKEHENHLIHQRNEAIASLAPSDCFSLTFTGNAFIPMISGVNFQA